MIKVSLGGGGVIDTQGELNGHVGMKAEYYGKYVVVLKTGIGKGTQFQSFTQP